MVELPLTGGCACGAVRFAVDAPLEVAWYCHCARCRHRTGTAASPGGRAAPGALRITAGADLVRAWAPYAAPWEPIPDDGLPRHPERLPPGTGPGRSEGVRTSSPTRG